MTGLQHGVATVTTQGQLTDHLLQDQDDTCFSMVPVGDQRAFAEVALCLLGRADKRYIQGEAGKMLYNRQFRFEAVAQHLLNCLRGSEVRV